MEVFGVDITAKNISIELDGKEYHIHFRDNLFKGTYDVSVWDKDGMIDTKITGLYPPLKELVRQLWRIYIPAWLRTIKFRRSHNR